MEERIISRRILLLSVVALVLVGACSSSDTATTTSSPAVTTQPTSTAPSTALPSTTTAPPETLAPAITTTVPPPTTVPPTTTSAPPVTTAPNPVRETFKEMLAGEGWATYEGAGWSLLHPPGWIVAAERFDSVAFVSGGGGIFIVLLDPARASDEGSLDHLTTVVEKEGGAFADQLSEAPRFVLDYDGDGFEDPMDDIAGAEFEFTGENPFTGERIPSGSSETFWWYGYYNPGDPGVDGAAFSASGSALRGLDSGPFAGIATSDVVALSFEFAVRPGAPVPGEIAGGGHLAAVTETATGYVAVGWDEDDGFTSWASPDGREWTPAGSDSDDFSRPLAVLAAGPGLIAAGHVRDDTLVLWSSDDGGDTWIRAFEDSVNSVPELFGLAERGGHIVAVGTDAFCEAAYWSDDGTTWERAATRDDPGPLGCNGVMYDVIARPEGFMAVGISFLDAAVWTSTDGRSWEFRGELGPGRMGSVVDTGDVLVAVGGDSFIFPTEAYAWTSIDGQTWKRTVVTDAIALNEVAMTADGTLIAFGQTEGGAAAWTSTDGKQWERIPGWRLRTRAISGVSIVGDRIVVVGEAAWSATALG